MGLVRGLQFVTVICMTLSCDSLSNMQAEFEILHTWDSNPVNHDPIRIIFSPGVEGLKMKTFAPFFDDPQAPAGPPGQPFPGLWDYEVVESFFLDSTTDNYLEVEICPHGQHLVLLLSGVGQAFQQQLPMVFNSTVTGDTWMGEALLPWIYFPPNVNKMNSYAIHGSGVKRTYEALYPIPSDEVVEGQKPNLSRVSRSTYQNYEADVLSIRPPCRPTARLEFHALKYFGDFRLQSIMGHGWEQPESELWKGKP